MNERQLSHGERKQRLIDQAVHAGRAAYDPDRDLVEQFKQWKAAHGMSEFAFSESSDTALRDFYHWAVVSGSPCFSREYVLLRDNPRTNRHLLDWIEAKEERREEIRALNWLTDAVFDGRKNFDGSPSADDEIARQRAVNCGFEAWVYNYLIHLGRCFCGKNVDRPIDKKLLKAFYQFAVVNKCDRGSKHYKTLKQNSDKLRYVEDWIDSRFSAQKADPEVLFKHLDEIEEVPGGDRRRTSHFQEYYFHVKKGQYFVIG